MPEGLRTVHDIVQEAGIKTIPKKKKCKKAKWLSEEALQIAEKRREVKGKGEKKRYISIELFKKKNLPSSTPSAPPPPRHIQIRYSLSFYLFIFGCTGSSLPCAGFL